MKAYKYSTKDRAQRVAKSIGCTGYHSHNEDGKKIYMPCKTMEIFKEKTKKKKEEEVNELIDVDGTWLTSNVGRLDPASTVKGSTITDKIVPMSRNPRDPLLRGWYGYYGEGVVKEEDMEDAFGFEDTKFMDYKDTVKHYEKKLGLDKEDAVDRARQQGKGETLKKKAPKKIKNLKNFVDRLVLKELDDEIHEDILVNKNSDDDIKSKIKDINPLLLRNIKSLKKMAKDNGITVQELVRLLKNEQ